MSASAEPMAGFDRRAISAAIAIRPACALNPWRASLREEERRRAAPVPIWRFSPKLPVVNPPCHATRELSYSLAPYARKNDGRP